MKAFKASITFTEKEGFTKEGLLEAIQSSLKEINLRLYSFDYKKDAEERTLDLFNITKKFSKCECIIEYKNFSGLPYHQIVLGGFSSINNEYPYIDIQSIDSEFVDISL